MIKKVIIPLLFILIFFTTCRYKEGPIISTHSVVKRLFGSWQVIGFTSDGIDSLQNYIDNCNGKMRIWQGYSTDVNRINFDESKLPSMGGLFTFSDNKKIMKINFGDTSIYNGIGPFGGGRSEWKILKLTMKEFKISTDFNGRNYIISFKK